MFQKINIHINIYILFSWCHLQTCFPISRGWSHIMMSQFYYYILTWAALIITPSPSYPILCTLSYFIVFIITCDNIEEWWRIMKKVMFIVWDAAFQLEVFSVWKMMVQKERAAVDSCLYTDCLGRIRKCTLVFFLLKNRHT